MSVRLITQTKNIMKHIITSVLLILLFGISCSKTDNDEKGPTLLDSAERDYLVGDYIESMKSVHEYLKASAAGDIRATPELDMKAYKFLGNIHYIYGDKSGACECYKKALAKSDDVVNQEERLKLLFNLSITNSFMKDKAESQKYIDKIADVRKADPWLRSYFRVLASAYHERIFGDTLQFIEMMRRSLRIVEEHSLETYLKFTPYEEISSWLEMNGRYDEALAVLRRYERELEDSGESPERMVSCLKGYMEVYAKLGDRDNALDYQTRYMTLSDSLKNRQKFFKANNLFKEYSDEIDTSEDLEMKIPFLHISVTAGVVMAVVGSGLYIRRRMTAGERVGKSRNTGKQVKKSGMTADSGQEPVHGELFDRIQDTMEEPRYFTDPDFSVEVLAATLGSNVRYVSLAVSSHTGSNFRSFLNARRIRYARQLLDSEEGIQIHDLASRVGFLSQSAFIGAFRRETGMTPSRYQKSLREREKPLASV